MPALPVTTRGSGAVLPGLRRLAAPPGDAGRTVPAALPAGAPAATRAKTAFVAGWDPVTARYGLTQYQSTQL